MSGADPNSAVAFVAATPESFAVDALTVLDSLPASLPSWALVGGVAVAVNLAGFHRPTGDLDAVSIDGEHAIAILIGEGASTSRNGVRMTAENSEIEFDIIDVSEGDWDTGAFVAHRFALETAVRRALQAVSPTGEILLATKVPVATPAATVAMKLHSVEGRRESRPDKRSGDIFDIVRLVGAHGAPVLARTLRQDASDVLVTSTARQCQKYFIDEVDRSYRWLRMDSRSAVSDVVRADLAPVGELVTLLA